MVRYFWKVFVLTLLVFSQNIVLAKTNYVYKLYALNSSLAYVTAVKGVYNLSLEEKTIKAKRIKQQIFLVIKAKNYSLKLLLILSILFLAIICCVIFLAYRHQTRLNLVLTHQKEAIQRKNIQIINTLKDKEILLKEVHHRVKNNLQIISSLLNLQARNVTDESSLIAIEEGKERIQAIALIHQQLYQGTDISKISIENYLKELSAQLLYTHSTAGFPIEINIKATDIQVNLDTSVPLGLIANELFTNAYKHAFNRKMDAKIDVSIVQFETQNRYMFHFEDNGNGLPAGFVWEAEDTLGVEIINALVSQLDGELKHETGDWGTRFEIEFSQA